MGVESFTVMAILDAQDKASEIFERVKGVIERFSGVLDEAAANAEAASSAIDESLLQTASGADALALANDRVTASEAKLTLATREQAMAETQLMDVRARGASLEELAAAADKLAAANKGVATATTELQAVQEAQTAVARASTVANDELATSEEAVATGATGIVGVLVAAGVAVAATGAMAVKAAGDFQSAVVHLTTDAGESAANLQMVSAGLLQIANDTGTATDDMAKGMYHIESAGFHGAEGLEMMRIAAEGAKVGNAELDTVSKTLAGTMDSYKEHGYSAVQMMNMMIETTAAGDLRMQNLASSLGNVTPIAAAAGLEFEQVGGAIATMTAQNMSAAQATQNLAHLIQSLSKPNNVQIEEMRQMGIDSNDLAQNLGTRGLTGTLDILMEAIAKHTKNGQVFIDSLHNSESAAADAQKMLSLMPPTLRKMSEDLENGKTSVGDFKKAIKELNPEQFQMGNQFLLVNEKMGSFNKLLASGKPEAETFNSALSTLTGGQVSLRTALMLSANGGEYFKGAVEKIGEAAKETGTEVKNWDTIQATFNNQVERAKTAVETYGIKIGTMLMPYVEKLIGYMSKAFDWFSKNKFIVDAVSAALGGGLVSALVTLAAILGTVLAVVVAVGSVFYGLYKAVKFLISWVKSNAPIFSAIWKEVLEAVHKVAQWFDENVLQWLRDRFQDLKKWWAENGEQITELWKTFMGVILVQVEWLWAGIKATLSFIMAFWDLAWGLIKDTFKMVWDIIRDVLRIAFDNIKDWLAVFIDIFTGKWGKAWQDIKTAVKDNFRDVVSFFADFGNNALDLLYDAGKNLIKGLINGIKSAWGSLKSSISDIASSIRGYFPFSPAKTGPLSGRGDIGIAGSNIVTSLAKGMSGNIGLVTRASAALAAAARPNVAGVGFNAGLPALSQGGASGGNVVIDMRGSQLMSDRDMDAFVDRVGRRIATRILPAGGVRIQA